jgi:hypothetical protein
MKVVNPKQFYRRSGAPYFGYKPIDGSGIADPSARASGPKVGSSNMNMDFKLFHMTTVERIQISCGLSLKEQKGSASEKGGSR